MTNKLTIDKEATITVTKSILLRKQASDSSETDILEVRQFQTTPANVSFAIERTVALEPYCSLKMRLEVNVPCYVEEVKDVQSELSARVPKRLDALIENWLIDKKYK